MFYERNSILSRVATFYIFAHLCSAGLSGRRPGSRLAAAGRCAVTRHAASRTLPWARGRTERQHCNSSDLPGPPTVARGPRRLGDPGASLQVAVQTFPPRTRTALAALPPATPSFPFCCVAPPRAPGTERQQRQPGTRGGAGGLASSTGLSFFTCELRRATVPASWAAV